MQTLKMDFQSQSAPPVVPVMQFDAQSRFIGITLYNGGVPYEAPEGASYTVQYRGPGANNMGWYDTITLSSGTRKAVIVDSASKNVVTLELAEQALRVNGNVFVNLCVVTNTGYMLKTFPILCRVTGAAFPDTVAVQSFFYVTGITSEQWLAYVTACQDAQKRAEDAAATFETDPTLSLSGKAADAAKVGEAIGQQAYLTNPKIDKNLYIKDDCTILGYDGWDLLSIPVIAGDRIIVYSPVDSKYNAMYSADATKYKNFVLKNGINYIDIPDGYRALKISNEREIAKNVRFFVLPMQTINSNKEKLKIADNGKFLLDEIPYTYINNADGTERSSDAYSSSDYIDLTGHKKFVIECQEDSESNALYDESYNFLQGIEYKAGFTEFVIPTNAKYLRISCHTNCLKTAGVIFDSSISYRNFTHNGAILPRVKGWESDRETIIDEAYHMLLNVCKKNPDIIPIFVCTDSHRWSPQHPQRYVNNIDTDGMKIANINLGDDVTEHWDDLKFDTIYNNIRYIKNYIGVCGNHDKWDGTSTTEYFLRRIFTSKKARYIAKSKRCCYTVKDDLHNVKYIIFDPYYAPNSGVPMVSVPTVVATWFIKELSKNDGYDIIFLNHQPLTDNNIHRDGTKQTWKMESYEEPIFSALFNVLKNRKNKRKGTYTDTDGIAHQYDFSQCENDLLCLLHGHSHEELYYIEDGLTSYVCDWDGAESTGYKSTFIAIDRSKEILTAWIAKGSENVEPALELKIN